MTPSEKKRKFLFRMPWRGEMGLSQKWCSKKKKNTCPSRANAWLRSANAPLMMPNERRIKLNKAPFS
jgi:hypothetical protein